MRRALIRLALLMRVVPLAQAAATLAFGFSVYQRVWLGAAAGFLALAWSAWLALRVWPGARTVAPFCPADTLIAVLALLVTGPAMPASLLATAFYWPATYAAVVALMLAMSLPPVRAAAGLALLLAGFGLVTGVQAGVNGIAAAAGNVAGSAVYFVIGAVIAAHARKLTDALVRSGEAAARRQTQLGVEQARLDEFRRLHDEAVQVLERVSAADSREETALRVYAASAAEHLRAAIDRPGDQSGSVAPSVRAALDRATAGFAALGFRITVLAEEPLPHLDFHALTELGSAVTEALNNSVKHSGACSAVVRARRASDRVEVSVEDEGAGFAAGPARYGFGITHSICRRLAEAGGGAEVRSAPGAGTVVTMWLPMLSRTGMQTWAYPGLRPERTLTMLALASRAAYCLYSAAVVALNLAGYRRPALAVAALVVALASSAWLGARVYRARTVSAPVAVLDTAVAAAVLIMVAAAIAPSGRTGSLNWALAYAVACAFWLAFGEGRTLRAVLACALGIVYGVSVLHGAQAGTAVIITAVVNAASPPMYFGIAAAVSWVMHRTSAEVSAARELEQRQRRELAALAERGRLVREVHGSVLATLDSIAARQRPWEELRGRARAEVSALRATLSGTVGAGPADPLGLRGRLACLIRDRAGQGWRIDLVDDEIERDPPPEVIEALCAALAELTEGSPPPDGLSRVRAQSCAAAAHADVLIRVPVCGQAIAGLVGQARSRLTTVGGTAELERALPGEVRVRLRAPV